MKEVQFIILNSFQLLENKVHFFETHLLVMHLLFFDLVRGVFACCGRSGVPDGTLTVELSAVPRDKSLGYNIPRQLTRTYRVDTSLSDLNYEESGENMYFILGFFSGEIKFLPKEQMLEESFFYR